MSILFLVLIQRRNNNFEIVPSPPKSTKNTRNLDILGLLIVLAKTLSVNDEFIMYILKLYNVIFMLDRNILNEVFSSITKC